MTFTVHVHNHLDSERSRIERLLQTLITLTEKVIMTNAELVTKLDAVTAKVTKIGTETRSLLTKIDELNAVIAAGVPVPPEVEAALTALNEQAEIVDQEVPDAPTP